MDYLDELAQNAVAAIEFRLSLYKTKIAEGAITPDDVAFLERVNACFVSRTVKL